jgi:putative addiction module component (TIGR02574 family)
MNIQNLVEEARKLSHAEQALLLDELIRLIGPEAADLELTDAQRKDLDRRIDEFESGKATLIPGDEVFRRLRAQ